MKRVSEHFKSEELKCPCCGKNEMNYEFLQKLELIRSKVGHRLRLNSAFRCKAHNMAVGGWEYSAHLVGRAADIRVASPEEKFDVVKAAMEAGIHRIGVGANYVHVDDNPEMPRAAMWLY